MTTNCYSEVFLRCTFQEHVGHIAFEGNVDHRRLQTCVSTTLSQFERFRTHKQNGPVTRFQLRRVTSAQLAKTGFHNSLVFVGLHHNAAEWIILAHKGSHESCRRLIIDRLPVGNLFNHAIAHYRDTVGHRQCLTLVVRDVDKGNADTLLNGAQFIAHVLPQFQIKC